MKNKLRVLRAERNWSQAKLAEELEVSRQTINAIEGMDITDEEKEKIFSANALTILRLPV